MAIIGTFTRNSEGFSGTIKTLTFSAKIKLVPTHGSEGENAPDYRVLSSAGSDVGAGWKRIGEKAGDYVALLLDDPAFVQPMRANLIRSEADEKAFVLLWSRPARRD